MAVAPFMRETLDPAEEQARAAIGSDRFDEAYRIGAATGVGEAAAYALG